MEMGKEDFQPSPCVVWLGYRECWNCTIYTPACIYFYNSSTLLPGLITYFHKVGLSKSARIYTGEVLTTQTCFREWLLNNMVHQNPVRTHKHILKMFENIWIEKKQVGGGNGCILIKGHIIMGSFFWLA